MFQKSINPIEIHTSSGIIYQIPIDGLEEYAICPNTCSVFSNKSGNWLELKSSIHRDGYRVVNLTYREGSAEGRKKRQRAFTIHSLLYITLKLGRDLAENEVIGFINGKQDCQLENLRLLTRSENSRLANAELAIETVTKLWADFKAGVSNQDIIRRYNISPDTFYNIKNGFSWNSVTGILKKRSSYKPVPNPYSKPINASLSDSTVLDILECGAILPSVVLSKRYNMSLSGISNIFSGRTYKHIPRKFESKIEYKSQILRKIALLETMLDDMNNSLILDVDSGSFTAEELAIKYGSLPILFSKLLAIKNGERV